MKWLKLAFNTNSYNHADAAVECALDCCVPYYSDGIITQIFVQSDACRLAIDCNGKHHNISQWNCESMAELELQAMLNGCLSGLSEGEEAAIKAVAESVLSKKLAEVEKKAKELADENVTLSKDLREKTTQLSGMKLLAEDAYTQHMSLGPDNAEAWNAARRALAILAAGASSTLVMDPDADVDSSPELGGVFDNFSINQPSKRDKMFGHQPVKVFAYAKKEYK